MDKRLKHVHAEGRVLCKKAVTRQSMKPEDEKIKDILHPAIRWPLARANYKRHGKNNAMIDWRLFYYQTLFSFRRQLFPRYLQE